MKRLRVHSASCSCTTCVYRSRSKQPSVQQIIEDGSRIDKLYYGEYLPLRERKLLEKLIRTRAVYDGLRNQLISTSGSSDQTRSEHKIKRREDDSTEKSSAVIKIVDLVDRGHIGSSNTSKLSSCCSCCSCSSLRKIKKHMEKHPRVHRHHVPYEDIARYTVEAEKRGRRRRRQLSTKISSKIRAVHFKMKKIRSEPCTCTLSLSSVTRLSKGNMKKKVQSKEKVTENAQSQKVVKIDRKALTKKIYSCSCKIAKLPIKSLKKIKNIRTSTTKDSGTEMRNQRDFRIKKDSITLFREKLLKKQIYQDWECEPGTCVVDECIPEQCLKKVKATGFRETKGRKYRSRHSGTERDRSRISMSTRPRKVKVIESRVQARPRAMLGPVACECKPTSKPVSSMTSFPKPKHLTEIKSTSTELKVKRPKQKPQIMLKETTYKAGRYPPKPTESFVFYDTIEREEKKQALPESELGSITCECKPTTISTHSMTTIVKKQTMQSTSKSEIKVKKPVTPKPRQQFETKDTTKQEKVSTKSGRHEKEHEKVLMQVSSKSNLGHVICECKPSTKSISSMTSIPKAKASKTMKPKPKPQLVIRETVIQDRAYKKALPKPIKTISHEIEHRQISDLRHVICECRPSTKSTSSMISVPESKIKDKKRFPKPIKPKKNYKAGRHKLRREPYSYYENKKESELQESEKQAVKISSSFKFEIEFSKKKHPALNNKELIKHVKAKRAKRTKPTHSRTKQYRKYQHSKTQFTGALPKASQESYLRESASQTFKPYRGMVLPFPRECDPLMCIPYECDPEKCARILLSRSKSRGRSAMSSTDRLRRKSVGSTTFSQKTSSKSKYIQSKSAQSFIRKYKDISKGTAPQTVEKNIGVENFHPQKQAVRISSSFSFDIEFYKEKSPDAKAVGETEPQKKFKQKEHRRKYKHLSHGTRNVSSRQNISSQSRSSQSFKNIQVEHRLKRCFCTLKLMQKKKQKVRHTVSKKTMASLHVKELEKGVRIRQTQTKSSGIAYVIPPVTSTRASLLPYECEPFFCTPGDCNPYECAERIKRRNRREANRVPKETNTAVIRRKSTFANTSQLLSKSLSRKVQSSGYRNKKQKARHSHSSKLEPKVTSDKSERQAVRIGSSFNFNIEFSKKKNNQLSVHKKNEFISDKPIRKETKHKGIKVYKTRVHHETSETTKLVKPKQTYTEPFLQRCLCTLKLLKKNKKKVETLSPWPNKNGNIMHIQNKSITTNRADIRYNLERPKLLPYECEPGICVPDECDPYKCEKFIKLRHMKLQHKYSNTGDLATQSTFSETSRTVTSNSRNIELFTREKTKKVKNTDRDSNEINTMPNSSKQQAVRVGSSFSFNIEFSKEKSSPNKSKDNVITTEDVARKHKPKNDKLTTTGSQQFKRTAYHESIDAKTKLKEKGSYIGSAIKRCFCTLKFHKKEKNAGQQNINNVISKSTKTSYPLPNPQICECKSTSTKISKPIYDLIHECAPNFCIPGMCDPYECFEEIKLREIKRLHDRYVSTNIHKRKSVMSLTTNEFSGSSKAKNTQTRFLKHTEKNDQKVRVISTKMKPTRSLLPSHQAVRIGSNFSFNIEFSKNRFVPSIQDATNKSQIEKYKAARATSLVTKIKDKGTKNTRVALKHRLSQANKIRKENKASNVSFLLKRCFCTLGLQKKKNPKPDFRRNQPPITTQFVQVVQVDQNKIKMPKSNSYTKRARLKSRIDFDDYQKGHLLNTQKINPFYQSFHALNVQVSKLKNTLHNNRALEDNDCDHDVCVPYECDPTECLKRINNRLKRSKLIETDRLESKSVGCYKKLKLESKATVAHPQNRKARNGTSQKSPVTVGSDLSIRMGLYKDTDPYRNDVIITHTPRQALRMESDLRINMAFFKNLNPRSDGVMMTAPQTSKYDKDTARQNLRHTDSQANYETKDKATGISRLLTRCFCTAKLNKTRNFAKTDKRKIGSEPEKNKNATKPEKNMNGTKTKKNKKATKLEENKIAAKSGKNNTTTKPEKNKTTEPAKNKKSAKPGKNTKNTKKEKANGTMATKRIGHSVGIDYPKYKSTSSLSRRRQSLKSKAKDWSSCSNYCVPKKRQQHRHSYRSSDKHHVTFGSNIHYNMDFFKDRSHKIMFSPEMGLSKYNQIQGIGDGDERRQNGLIADTWFNCSKCKNQAKKKSKRKETKKDLVNVDSILYRNQCEPHLSVHKRQLRSKNTQVNRKKYATSVKSVVTDTGTIKSGPKSFKECQPYYCVNKLKALGIIEPDVNKTIKKKVKQTSLSTQNVKSYWKSSNTDKQKPSVFKKCFCVLTLRISKQAIINQNEKGTSMNKKTDLNKFMEKCYCRLKHIKGSKQLTPKQSTERIVNVKKKDDTRNVTEISKPYLKLEKKADKTKQAEMKTIMPYSKKKFKKLESKTKVTEGATDTTGTRMCPCAKTTGKQNSIKKVKQNTKTKTKDQKGPQAIMFCPVCKNVSNTKSGKRSLHTCVCPNMDMCLCNEQAGDRKNALNKDLEGLCPVCIAKVSGKYNKKRDRKLCTCMGDGKQVGKSHTCGCLLQMSENVLCPVCNNDNNNSQKKMKKDKKKREKAVLQNDDQSECLRSVCPCCKKKFSIDTIQNIKQCMMSKISSVCSSLFNKRKPPPTEVDNTPLFEMLVNKNNMKILNRDEVFKNLGSSGKESRAMKKARKAIQKGNVDPPHLEVIIDKSTANIVNSDRILKQINSTKRQKGKSLPARETIKAAPVSQTRNERKASKSHGSKCKCCVCSKYKKQKPGSAFAVKPRKLKPCICGSVLCKKDWNKLKKEQMSIKSFRIKPCVCGSDICREESQKMPELLLEAARQAQRAKEQAKIDTINEKLYQKARKQRKKQYRIEDKQRWKVRRKEDRREMKLVKKYDTAPNVLMVAESLIDLGTFGHKAFCDIMRSIFRVARHPRDGVHNIKDAIRNPAHAAKDVKQSCKGMGLYSTLARIKRRILKMPLAKSAIAKMESYPVTNYLIHITDKDPKHRMKKFKNRRLREPLDFECSLFMGSLRKRPCLRVYYMCPWFYPHCVSLLGIWKQFTDILLFILAVGVWSPCILCMELCRAMMCCCLCTG